MVEYYYNSIQKSIGFDDNHTMSAFVDLENNPQSGHKNSKQEVSSSDDPKYIHPENTEDGQELGKRKLREEWPKIKYKLRKVGT